MPEVHVIGEVLGASDFEKSNLFCKYQFLTNNDKWTVLDGISKGQTQLSLAEKFEKDVVVWNHPVDVYYATSVLSGWPKVFIEVWHEDKFGRNELSGYGVCHVPCEPGEHLVECVLWKPQGSFVERIYKFFLDTSSHLEHKELVHSTEDRFDLFTETVGSVHLRLDVVTRGFKNKGVAFKE